MVFWLFKKKEDFNKKFTELHDVLNNSFVKVKDDMNSVANWLNHFNNKHKEHDKRIYNLQEKVEELENIIKNVLMADKVEEKREETFERVQTFKRSNQTFMNVQTLNELTPAQKQVLGLLIYSGGPLGYEDIAKKLGLNIITIRRHMIDLKRSGIKIDEKVSVKNRRKLFYVDEKAKKVILKQKVRVK